jgi:hypothetical protein
MEPAPAKFVSAFIAVPLAASLWFWVVGIFRIPRVSVVQGTPLATVIGLSMYISLLAGAAGLALVVPYMILTGG